MTMATILRVDTPAELRDLDAQLGNPVVFARIVLSLIFAAVSPIVLVFAILARSPIGVVVSVGWFALWTGWIFRLQHRLKAARPYRVRVRVGIDEIREAHDIYRRLSPQSTDYAVPLILTMYRISVIEVRGELGERRLLNLMKERTSALRNLLAAEDEVAVATAMQSVDDRDDLDAMSAWRDALAEVEAKLTFTI
jgi:hypothetical protein